MSCCVGGKRFRLGSADCASFDALASLRWHRCLEHGSCLMRWAIVTIVGIASMGTLAVSVSMNFAFGSSSGRIALDLTPTAPPSVSPTSSKLHLPSLSLTAPAIAHGCGAARPALVGNLRPFAWRCPPLVLPQPTEPSRWTLVGSGSLEAKPAGKLGSLSPSYGGSGIDLASPELRRSERLQLIATAIALRSQLAPYAAS